MNPQPDDQDAVAGDPFEDARVRGLMHAVLPCPPCMAAKVFPDSFKHACTGEADLPKGQACPCPCAAGES